MQSVPPGGAEKTAKAPASRNEVKKRAGHPNNKWVTHARRVCVYNSAISDSDSHHSFYILFI